MIQFWYIPFKNLHYYFLFSFPRYVVYFTNFWPTFTSSGTKIYVYCCSKLYNSKKSTRNYKGFCGSRIKSIETSIGMCNGFIRFKQCHNSYMLRMCNNITPLHKTHSRTIKFISLHAKFYSLTYTYMIQFDKQNKKIKLKSNQMFRLHDMTKKAYTLHSAHDHLTQILSH